MRRGYPVWHFHPYRLGWLVQGGQLWGLGLILVVFGGSAFLRQWRRTGKFHRAVLAAASWLFAALSAAILLQPWF